MTVAYIIDLQSKKKHQGQENNIVEPNREEEDHVTQAAVDVDSDKTKPRRGARKKKIVDYYDGIVDDDDKKLSRGSKASRSLKKNVVVGSSAADVLVSIPEDAERPTVANNDNEPALMKPKVSKTTSKRGKMAKKGSGKANEKVDVKKESPASPFMAALAEEPASQTIDSGALNPGIVNEETEYPEEKPDVEVRVVDVEPAEEIDVVLRLDDHGDGVRRESESMKSRNSIVSQIKQHNAISHDETEVEADVPDTAPDASMMSDELQQAQDDYVGAPRNSRGVLDNESDAGPSKSVFAANLVSSVKTMLPQQDADASIDQESLRLEQEAAELKKRQEKERLEKEEADKRMELERLKAVRLKEEAEKARMQEELKRQKEEEIAARRRAKQEEENRKREEKARRLEEHKKRRKLEAEAAARSGSVASGPAPTVASGGSLAAAKERLAKIQQQAAMLKKQTVGSKENMSIGRNTISGTPKPVQLHAPSSMVTPPPQSLAVTPSNTKELSEDTHAVHNKSYEISPYRSDHDSDDDVPKKPVPDWARGKKLMAQLTAQLYVDPDEIFQQHAKTCSLDQVFASCRKSSKQDFNRRSSSGNWIEDRVTWKEELGYKKAMGYI